VNTLTYHRCRAEDFRGKLFTIDVCHDDEVIDVQSAEYGYSAFYKVGANLSQCPWRNCTKPTDTPAKMCNGKRSCSIDQDILIFTEGSRLCPLHIDANFIRITFSCVAGISLLCFVFTARPQYRALY